MTLKEFLSLPRRKKSPNRRLRDELESMREELEVTGGDTSHESHRCCGKRAYDTWEEAMGDIRGFSKNSKKPFRAYQCPEGRWHLSGVSKKSYNRAKKHF